MADKTHSFTGNGGGRLAGTMVWRLTASPWSLALWRLRGSLRDRWFWGIFLVGLLLGRATLLGSLSPFAAALFALLLLDTPSWAAASAAGSILGAAWGRGLPGALGVGLTLLLYRYLTTHRQTKGLSNAELWMLGACVLAGQGAVLFFFDPTPYNLAVAVVQAALTPLAAAVVREGLAPLLGVSGGRRLIDGPALVAQAITAAFGLVGLADLHLGLWQPFTSLATVAVGAAALVGGSGLGAVAGAAAGVAALLSGAVPAPEWGLFAFGGLLAGYFAPWGSLGAAVGFAFGTVLVLLPLPVAQPQVALMVSAAAGLVTLAAAPRAFWLSLLPSEAQPGGWGTSLLVARRFPPTPEVGKLAVQRLQNFSSVCRELASAFHQAVAVRQETAASNPEPTHAMDRLAHGVCAGCVSYHLCWERNFFDTYKAMIELLAQVEDNPRLTAEELTGFWKHGCKRPLQMLFATQQLVEDSRREDAWQQRLRDSQSLVATQLEGLARVMEDLAESVVERELFNRVPAAAAPSLTYVAGVAKSARNGRVVSGDSHLVRPLESGQLLVLLSDGMGTGTRAALESQATVALLGRLLDAGLPRDAAIRAVNSILVLRSVDDTFATVDLAAIDLSDGSTEFLKIGAATSFLKRGAEVRAIRNDSLPIGILRDIDIETKRVTVKPGDWLIMVSDGILEARRDLPRRDDWMIGFLKATPLTDPKRLAAAILEEASALVAPDERDDMTVIAIHFRDAT